MKVRAVLILAIFMHGSAMSQGSSEALSIQPPKIWGNWKQATEQRAPDGTHLTAWVPHDQDTANWNEAISVFTFPSRPAGDVTTNAIRTIVMQANAACANLNIVPPKPRAEGPFTVAYAQIYCTERRDTKLGRVDFLKAIASEHRVYLIIAMKTVKPFHIAAAGAFNFADDESIPVVEWLRQISEYLETSVRVCAGPAEKRDLCSR